MTVSKRRATAVPILENFVISTKFQEMYLYYGQCHRWTVLLLKSGVYSIKFISEKVREFQISSYVVYERPFFRLFCQTMDPYEGFENITCNVFFGKVNKIDEKASKKVLLHQNILSLIWKWRIMSFTERGQNLFLWWKDLKKF